MSKMNIALYRIPQCIRHLHESIDTKLTLHDLTEYLLGCKYAAHRLNLHELKPREGAKEGVVERMVACSSEVFGEILPHRPAMKLRRFGSLDIPKYYAVGPGHFAVAMEMVEVAALSNLADAVVYDDIGSVMEVTYYYPPEYHEYRNLLGHDMDQPIDEMVMSILDGEEPVIDPSLAEDNHALWVFTTAVTALRIVLQPAVDIVQKEDVRYAISIFSGYESWFTLTLTKDAPEPF